MIAFIIGRPAVLFGILFFWGKKWNAPLIGWLWAISVIFLLFGILAGVTIPEVDKDTELVDQQLTQESIQGIWNLKESKVSGKPNETVDEGILHISGNECSWIFRDKETITAAFTLNANADPAQVIWEYPEQNGDAAREIHEIVRLDGNRLIFSATNDDDVAPTVFWKSDEGHSTTVYQRKEANKSWDASPFEPQGSANERRDEIPAMRTSPRPEVSATRSKMVAKLEKRIRP